MWIRDIIESEQPTHSFRDIWKGVPSHVSKFTISTAAYRGYDELTYKLYLKYPSGIYTPRKTSFNVTDMILFKDNILRKLNRLEGCPAKIDQFIMIGERLHIDSFAYGPRKIDEFVLDRVEWIPLLIKENISVRKITCETAVSSRNNSRLQQGSVEDLIKLVLVSDLQDISPVFVASFTDNSSKRKIAEHMHAKFNKIRRKKLYNELMMIAMDNHWL